MLPAGVFRWNRHDAGMDHHKPPRTVILTGAGISAESGIATFRDSGGLWEGEDVTAVATPAAFRDDPARVQRFYNQRRRDVIAAQPNAAHAAIARLQEAWGSEVVLVTQNVDDLHERSGSPQVLHMHGSVTALRNIETGEVVEYHHDVPEDETKWRPHIVWFGEQPIGSREIVEMLFHADLFIAIGTSGTVTPASNFVDIAASVGARTIEVNRDATEKSWAFDDCLGGLATDTVPKLVDRLLAAGEATNRAG